jgi:DNA polymerase elongation subunit (family B)
VTSTEHSIQAVDDEIPEVPGSDVPQGVLPRLIATLVNRRKQVKGLMKDKSAGPVKQLQVCSSDVPLSCLLRQYPLFA